MVTVSPKHHLRWVQTRRNLLKKQFTKVVATKLKKSIETGDSHIKKHPKSKWTPATKSYVSGLEKPTVIKTDLIKDFNLAELVVMSPNETTLSIAFFAPMGDPLLICDFEKNKLTWKKFAVSEKSKKENQVTYLKKLSVGLKRQMGLTPPKKTVNQKNLRLKKRKK